MKFGQYELLERVAVGGMAEVYRGRVAGAEGFEKPVAIKRILPEYARDERFISMMLTEARIHSALSHRNIVQIHDLGISEDGEYFIVLEYVEGHDLRAVMEAATDLGVQIPDSLALHVADELAQALHFAHELTGPDGQPLGIIHRDVSPSNVLITNSGEVKLSDFGIAKRRHDHSFVGSLKGNLVYMSPEQAQRVPLDRRTDVFSLGAVLFEMLTGHKLREITDEVNGYREVASGAVRSARALRPDLPEAYEALLNRALAANPADRFPDAAAFGAAIRELRRENDAPVGPADMKELIELLNPPRRARNPVERSKVIRLGPEFKVLSGTQRPRPLTAPPAAPVPAPLADPPRGPAPSVGVATPVVSPGLVAAEMTGPKGNGNTNGNGKRVWTDARLSAATPQPAFSMPPTPPPPVIAPPPFVPILPTPPIAPTAPAGNGARMADPQATPPPPTPPARGDVATPAAASTRTRPFGNSISIHTRPADSAAPHDPASAMLTPPPGPGAFGPQSIPRAPSGPITATGWSAPPPLERSPLTPPAGTFRADVPSGRFVMPAAPPTFAVDAVEPRRGRGRSILVVLLVLVVAAGAGAAFVHFKVMPLKVALVWLKPATLAVTSEPSGATVKLDGRELPDKTPLRTEVKRDRVEHTLEFTRAGSLPARATMRFDRSVPLSQAVTLEAEPPPPPPPEPPPEPAVAAEPPGPVEAEAKAQTETESEPKADKAETKAEKRAAAKQAKLEAKREAKAAAKKTDKKAAKKADKKSKKAKAGKTKAAKTKASAEPDSEL